MAAPSKYTKAKAVVGYTVLLLVLLLTLFFIYKNINVLTQVEENTALQTDSITALVHEKDEKILELIESMSSFNEDLFLTSQDLDKLLDVQTEALTKRNVLTKSDTIITKPKKKKFFRRLAEAFVPSKSDSTVQVTRSVEVEVDTAPGATNEKANQVVKEIQQKINREKWAQAQRKKRAKELEELNESISAQIDLYLSEYEQQKLEELIERMEEARISRQNATEWIGLVAIVAVLLATFFCILLIRDINKRNRYRRALEASNKRAADLLQAREKLMLTITHDIKAPVGTIMGYSELLAKTDLDCEQQEYLKNMDVATNHVFKLVYDLLDYHSLDLNKADIKLVPFKLDDFIDETYQSFVPQFTKQGIAFKLDCNKDELDQWVVSDPIRIKQVLNNLISNALKFTDHGCVKLAVTLSNHSVTLQVSDTGRGMSDDEKKKIFHEFTRLASAQGKEGFGLGLSIVAKIVNRLGGSIEVESTLDEGTQFTVLLPVEIKDLGVAEGNANHSFPKPTRIALMDDDQIQLKLTRTVLEKHGAEVFICNHLNNLLELLKEEQLDLLITDIQMPEINGFDLVDLLRNSNCSSYQTIPILAVSARDQIDAEKMIEHGFIGVLKKPFSATDVILKYQNYLDGHLNLSKLQKIDNTLENPESVANSFNVENLLRFIQGDKEAMIAILVSFIEESEKYETELKDALEKKDRVGIGAICHKIYPMVKMIGSTSLSSKLSFLDQKKPTYTEQECITHVKAILIELEQLKTEVEKYLSSVK